MILNRGRGSIPDLRLRTPVPGESGMGMGMMIPAMLASRGCIGDSDLDSDGARDNPRL